MISSRSFLVYRMLAGVTAVAFSDVRPNSELTSYCAGDEPAAMPLSRSKAARHIWAPRQLIAGEGRCTNI